MTAKMRLFTTTKLKANSAIEEPRSRRAGATLANLLL
jgi:hypothetical protein